MLFVIGFIALIVSLLTDFTSRFLPVFSSMIQAGEFTVDFLAKWIPPEFVVIFSVFIGLTILFSVFRIVASLI